ncbi:IS3 family transposase [Mucilaginibacter ginkgonis]|uniref:IS3 family transposase n=1 Tax=Mucilaginibacter ginkgonis TaxID=2682091 RepID=A0A6I4I3A3_9SPHI|nr:IS3 family transposase [Mucilaginibacter ginkgonis]QQL48288.1 IS3 family transposase [Mucilaginibacter ginkgonis]QQL49053.1 IS3 family transposase [Mucilaginibacter ginkgonis]QQL49075.1 IS3 family transposase [Mucilaginibacter ginkgonis]QQL49260.1 IS3 family transposase [Mucilaginibacter ginkgonis]QQL49810.1 IS3 family transposase [Mucilaginibacter ginkgonis]
MQKRSRGLRELCRLLGYSSQAYYQHHRSTEMRTFKQEEIIQQVMAHRRRQPRLGARKLLELIRPGIGRDAFFELLRENGLLVRRKIYRTRTTFSCHRFKKYPDLTGGLVPAAPGRLWVSDITYIRVGQGFAYLSLVTDAYSRKIIGFCLSHDLSTGSCLTALEMALSQKQPDTPLIHHSDRGTQYCSGTYTALLIKEGIGISMTQSGNPRDNAIAERVNGILKLELLNEAYKNLSGATRAVRSAINTYNNLRPHSSIDMMTPQAAHRESGPLRRRWRNYYPNHQQITEQV